MTRPLPPATVTVDDTAPPSAGAAGRGQAATVDDTAPPSAGAAGRGQAATVDAILAGDVRAGARLMRGLDDREPDALALIRRLYRHTGRAYLVGVTGNPGAGKSTVVDALIAHYRAAGETVGVVAVDPTSPFSGGAILGDRVRMQRHAVDPGVFIRSVATRGHLGGLSRSTFDIAHVLDAMGYTRILIETVGVGQDEIDVMKAAHTTIVVTVPGFGDDIQAIKAGILEIADVLAVNKADRDGAARTERDLAHMLALRVGDRRAVGVVRTIATRGTADGSGITELAAAVEAHRARAWTGPDARARAIDRAVSQLAELVRAQLADRAARAIRSHGGLRALGEQLVTHATDPWTAAEQVVTGVA